MDPLEEAMQRMDDALDLSEGPERFQLIEEAVRYADIADDLDFRFSYRIQLIEDALSVGKLERALVELPWCVHQFNAERDRFMDEAYDLLWAYKNVLCCMVDTPQISLAQFDRIAEEMATLYDECGYNMRPIFYSRMVFAISCGDAEQATAMRREYLKVERDTMAHCHACERDTEVDYHLLCGDVPAAKRAARPILQGRMECSAIPQNTLATMLAPLAKLGEYETADAHQKQGYRMTRGDIGLLGCIAKHLAYQTHRDKLTSAAKIFERHIEPISVTFELAEQCRFYFASEHLFRSMAAKSKSGSRKVALPKTIPLHDKSSRYDLNELAEWFGERARELAEQFDKRNQNDYFSRTLPEHYQY